ncbi:sensor histidine kinase [Streptosporangium roseum]|uniref:Oxygen sensor histidine kinase NreB n=1 Tax=Streptosporangium roseum (strain ATCC 12428 / DSM 43021 / JCM 3005 / KCTC 9067 / NCIMB 10171 / NRRL 2505 / NI 9100) TaxID=479432 RepID=D2AUR1_STRRD|nr:sensor histidine kinase [Streptosporangium roseum]ACZ84923.1 Histidine kinase [Streptosporangium roseum DSM 43021]
MGGEFEVPAMRTLRAGLHGVFYVLLAIGLTRVSGSWAALSGGALLGAVYTAGLTLGRRRTAALVWLAAVVLVWAALGALTTDFVWLAFPLFFLCMHLLPPRAGVPAVIAVTAVTVGTLAVHGPALNPAQVVGPAIGAMAAVLMVAGYTALYRESERRRGLIDELTRTRAELAETQHEAGVLAERQRLAREIHDTLAQGLSSIVLLLRAAPPDPSGYVEEARHAAEDNLAEARRFVHALTPPGLDGSLEEALRRLCSREGAAFQLDGEPYTLPRRAEIALLRIAQGGLANVSRHAEAARAALTLTYMEDEVAMDIVDDGRGFDPLTRSGNGLGFIRDRAAELGGAVTVESAPGLGTALAVTLPVP